MHARREGGCVYLEGVGRGCVHMEGSSVRACMGRGCAHMEGLNSVHGERDVYLEGVGYMDGEREGVCIWKVECACMG